MEKKKFLEKSETDAEAAAARCKRSEASVRSTACSSGTAFPLPTANPK